MSTLSDSWHRFEGQLAKPIFDGLIKEITRANEWLDKNQEHVEETAKVIGEALGTAFRIVIEAIEWLMEYGSDVWLGIKIAVGIVLSPLLLVGGAIYAVVRAVTWLVNNFDRLGSIAKRVGSAIVDAFKFAMDTVADLPIVRQLLDAYDYFMGGSHSAASRAQATKDAKTMTPAEWGAAHPDYDTIPERTNQNIKPAASGRGPSDESAGPSAMVPSVSAGKQPIAMSIDVGGISVSSNATDPAAVAAEVGRVFDERLGYHLRRTMDEVA
jgi:hypothetical protein